MYQPRPSPTVPALLLLLATAVPAAGQDHDRHAMGAASDSMTVAETVQAYHDALQKGDTSAVLALLAEDVHILESGGMETRDEYRSHHLPGDMAFAAAVTRERTPVHVTLAGDVAWAVSTSGTSGTFRDRAVNSVGAELMVLTRQEGVWLIRAIHWSSRQAR